ncbi:uncharacterized protein P174DRAFT_418744 [Aspergillus novofumigatus IBT 16806]|uniref:ATP-grasp domain-containing protein n=1 Tax=Aspergillus novofumigatus (strain IBT 16806) TaxID=1392255 RepID=A0A2I1CJL2_ASPN1|nr:uncharacterized protein P174DRAFT_418744 [Aspergillus novofumigatus IBT 16806]PKX97810.1 hypothetical protein P174DRAFT_418744 [Aspergillus novofumigatus IBT 16806]
MAANLAVACRQRPFSRCARAISSSACSPTVAVLFQAIDPPVINGVRKPRKPGGYQDSGADIAYALRQKGLWVLTPNPSPSDSSHEGWSFPDTEEGIYSAVQQGATHLWANTILFASHPLQTFSRLTPLASDLYVVGQPPGLVENFDDKAFLNNKLRELCGLTLPRAWMVDPDNVRQIVNQIDRYPIVGKALLQHAEALLAESPLIMLEEFLTGEEATITLMPPTPSHRDYWSMVPVMRFNHADGIAPYNGVMAVTANSRVVSEDEMKDPAYNKVMRQCEGVSRLIGATAPIRVDVRRSREGSEFALFDINMKPNMTASAMGWDYGTLLQHILEGAQPLGQFRNYRSPF